MVVMIVIGDYGANSGDDHNGDNDNKDCEYINIQFNFEVKII
jgi:hypothetical protein